MTKEEYFKMNNSNDTNKYSIDDSLYNKKMVNNLNKGNILEELKEKYEIIILLIKFLIKW